MTVDSHFFNWLIKQHVWMQDAVGCIFQNQDIDFNRIQLYADSCENIGDNSTRKLKRIDKNNISMESECKQIAIETISDVKNVNALDDQTVLSFNPQGLSVIYGKNGSGKSGYMRILKKVCGNPYAEKIQTNVYSPLSFTPTCKFVINENGVKKDLHIELGEDCIDAPLKLCNVFDSMIAIGYVKEQNSATYEPFVFEVLSRLAGYAEQIKAELNKREEGYLLPAVEIPQEFSDREDAKWLFTLSDQTIIQDEYRNWNNEDDQEIDRIQDFLSTSNLKVKISNISNQINQIDIIKDHVGAKISLFTDAEKSKLLSAYEEYCAADKTAKVAKDLFSKTANELDRISVDIVEWRKMWENAKAYYDSTIKLFQENIEFGTPDSICPLCHQKLFNDVQERFASVDEYMCGKTQSILIEKKHLFEKSFSSMVDFYSANQVNEIIGSFVPPEINLQILNFFNTVEKIKNGEKDSSSINELCAVDVSGISDLLDKLKCKLAGERTIYENALAGDEQVRTRSHLELLKFRKWVFSNLKTIDLKIESQKRINLLQKSYQHVTTNKITLESNFLAQELIATSYIARFESELKALAPNIRVKLERRPSRKGRSPYKIVLDIDNSNRDHPEDVLSEGEQRIVALANFFANATADNELGPIIIDDPISSLDHVFEDKATRRIVELSGNHQTIIFTHRDSLLQGLKEKCKQNGISFKEIVISGDGKKKGVINDFEIFTSNVKSCLSSMESTIRESKKLEEDTIEYKAINGHLCTEFRMTIEKAIETILLGSIVTRFERQIRTQGKLGALTKINESDVKLLDGLMTKYSFTEHSQPEDSAFISISNDEIMIDITTLRNWASEFNKR